MGLFSGYGSEARRQPQRTIDGRVQRDPEVPGSLQRRSRLFLACLRQLSGDPLASPKAEMVPIGDGLGLEGLVAQIAPLFALEQSMIRWTALRGALTNLYVVTWDPSSRQVPFRPVVERVMGVGVVSDLEEAEPAYGFAPGWEQRLDAQQKQAALGIYHSVAHRLADYERYSKLDMSDVLTDKRVRINDAVALDTIAWCAVAMLRLGLGAHAGSAPAPDRLDEPGWYTDPLWGKAERYWDGTDWTARCRVRHGGRYVEAHAPMR